MRAHACCVQFMARILNRRKCSFDSFEVCRLGTIVSVFCSFHTVGSFIVAYVTNKMLEPPRLAMTLAATPVVAGCVEFMLRTQITLHTCVACLNPGEFRCGCCLRARYMGGKQKKD